MIRTLAGYIGYEPKSQHDGGGPEEERYDLDRPVAPLEFIFGVEPDLGAYAKALLMSASVAFSALLT